jgi:hypothetical protein
VDFGASGVDLKIIQDLKMRRNLPVAREQPGESQQQFSAEEEGV